MPVRSSQWSSGAAAGVELRVRRSRRIRAPLRRTSAVPDAPGVQHASFRNADDALHQEPRAEGRRARYVDDSARLVHDEAERGVGDDPGQLAGVLADAPVRAGVAGAGLRGDLPRARGGAVPDHGFRRGVAAAEFRRAGGVRRPDDHPRLPSRSRRRRAQRRADPVVGARHQPGERDDGRAEGRRRRVRQQRQRRSRRSARAGGSSIATRWRR